MHMSETTGRPAKDTFLFIPHTHWEGAVFKTREGYLEMGLPIILRALRLLKKYPDYRFVLDQVAYVRPFLKRYPEEAAAFRAHIAEGRLAIVGGLDVMPDVNMPCGESFIRQVLYGKGYFRSELGVDVTTGWQLDAFGHHAQLPQLMRLSGYHSFWSQRGVPHGDVPSEFIWEGLDGTRIPFYWLPGNYAITYGSPTTPPEFAAFMRQKWEFLAKHSLGPGRVGPAGADVCLPEEHVPELVALFNAQADEPFELRIGLPADYEAIVEARPELRPVISGDLNPIFQGTYSSRIELKQWTREVERCLLTAEKLGALLLALGEEVDTAELWQAWEPLLFNHAHDLMSGVMTDPVWEDTRFTFETAGRLAAQVLDRCLRRLVARIDTRGEGVALVVFNALSWPRTDVVFASAGFTELEATELELRDPEGESVPVQLLEAERANNGALIRAKVAFVAQDVPALGFAVYRLIPSQTGGARGTEESGGNVLENDLCRVEVDLAGGTMIRLLDKRTGWEALRDCGNVVALEQDHGDLWEPYRGLDGGQAVTMKVRHPAPPASAALPGARGRITRGPVFSEFLAEDGKLSSRIRLYAGLPRIEIHTRLLNTDRHVRYRVSFPTAVLHGQGFHEIPFGAVPHPEGVECPAQTWIDQSDGERGLALLNRGLPGNNVADGVLLLSLLRSATIGGYGYGGGYEPGMSSDTGLELDKAFAFDYALVPHAGTWREAGIPREGAAFNHPLVAVTAASQPTAAKPPRYLPRRWGLLDVGSDDILVSALKPGEQGGVVLRLFDAGGRGAEDVTLRFAVPVRGVEEVNLMEDPESDRGIDDDSRRLECDSRRLECDSRRLKFRPFEIKTLRLEF
jgi:alpha-mannosidase